MSDEPLVRYGIDIGAGTIKGSAVDVDGTELCSASTPTPTAASSAAVEDAILSCLNEVRAACPGGARLGLGAPGWVGADRQTVYYSPNLPWRDEPLGARIAARSGLVTVVENDANAAAWGEYRFGAGRAAGSLLTVTLGSGVGGAFVVDGRLVRGFQGGAGEIGHCAVDTSGRPCACGRRGCLENYASGRALARFGTHRGTDPARAVADGVAEAVADYRTLGRHLGLALTAAVLMLNPELVVVGGGVAGAFEHFGPETELVLRQELASWSRLAPSVVAAQLGPAAGRIGAADLADH